MVRPAAGPGTPPPGFPSPQEAASGPWPPAPGQPGDASSPPWGGDELPKDFGGTPWLWQGPEVFEESGGGSGKRIALIVAIVVLVLGGAVGAFFAFNGSHQQAAPPSSGPPAPSSSEAAGSGVPAGPFVALPGKVVLNSTMPISAAVSAGQPTAEEAQLLQRNGVTEVRALVAENNDVRKGIWVFQLGANTDPKAVMSAIDNFYGQSGWQQISNLPQGVVGRKLMASQANAFRAHYVTAGLVVRVEVYPTPNTSTPSPVAEMSRDFQALLNEETSKYQPTS